MKIEIKSRWTGSILFTAEVGNLRLAVEAAVSQGADLKGADLTGAYLTGAYLTGAYLTGADLTGAYLKGADLTGADLTGAYLKGADLTGADLKGADLTGAYLTGAYLTGAYLTGADLTGADLKGADLTGAYLKGAYLKGADLTGADLTGADLKGAVGLKDDVVDGEPLKHATPEESIVNLDKVREIVLDNEARLNMGTWHESDGWIARTCAEEATCGTSHCLAGWLQVCATDERVRKMDSHIAGIVQAPVAAKMFFRDGEETLAWLKDRKYAEEAAEYA